MLPKKCCLVHSKIKTIGKKTTSALPSGKISKHDRTNQLRMQMDKARSFSKTKIFINQMLTTIRHNQQGMKSGCGGALPEFRPVDLVVWTLEVEREHACSSSCSHRTTLEEGLEPAVAGRRRRPAGSQRHQRHGQANCLCN